MKTTGLLKNETDGFMRLSGCVIAPLSHIFFGIN